MLLKLARTDGRPGVAGVDATRIVVESAYSDDRT